MGLVEARRRVESEREVGDEPRVGAQEAHARRARGRSPRERSARRPRRRREPPGPPRARSAARGGSGSRRATEPSRGSRPRAPPPTSCASARVIPPGSFTCSESSLRPSTSTRLTLWISRTDGTAAAAAWTSSRMSASEPGSTWTTTSLPGSARWSAVLDRIGRRVALPDPGRGRDADHDVCELPAACLPHPQPAQLDRGPERGDRLARRRLGSGRRTIHQHVHVHADQPRGARRARARRRRARRPGRRSGYPARTNRSPTRTATEPARSLAKWTALAAERGAPGAPGDPPREHGPRRVDRDHDEDRDEDVRRGEHARGSSSRPAARSRETR